MVESPINWFGGKYYMANKIISIFPSHDVYIEVFGGSGIVLFKKQPSKIEIYNDVDKELYNFFKLLRDENKAEILKQKLDLTPFSREEFYNCRDTWKSETDEIEKVRKWYVTVMQSFSANLSSWKHTKSTSRRGMSQSVSQWLGNIEQNLPMAVERLKTVQIENLDFRKLIPKYDSENVLFYIDPPYVHDTRKMTYTYQHEMSDDDHEDLVDLLVNLKGKAVLSGYDNDIYNRLLYSGWHKIFLGEYAKSSKRDINRQRERGKEFLWINYETTKVNMVS